jgi:hypothetical protein
MIGVMPDKRPPKDPSQLGRYIVDVTSGETEKIEPPKKDPAAVALGRRGGPSERKDSQRKTRNERLSPTKRKAISKKAAKAR